MITGLRLALLPRFACGVVAMGKRKAQSKVYAVRVGRKVGIFSSWEACSQQVGSSAFLLHSELCLLYIIILPSSCKHSSNT